MSRRRILFLARCATTAGLVWLLLTRVSLDDVGTRLTALEPWWGLAAVAASAAMAVVTCWRWAIVARLAGAALPAATTARLFAIGLFFNQTLPTNVGGDAVRIWLAWRAGAPGAGAAAGVVVDRAAGLAGLLLLGTATIEPLGQYIGFGSAWWGAVGMVVCGWIGVVTLAVGASPLAHLAKGRRWIAPVHAAATATRIMIASPRISAGVLALSLAGHLLTAAMLVFLARGLHVALPTSAVVAVVPTLLIVSLAPITLAGWGVREQASIIAFGAMGLAAADAATLSIAFGLLVAALGLPGALLWAAGPERSDPHLGNGHESR